jgi:hypothetical protein
LKEKVAALTPDQRLELAVFLAGLGWNMEVKATSDAP